MPNHNNLESIYIYIYIYEISNNIIDFNTFSTRFILKPLSSVGLLELI